MTWPQNPGLDLLPKFFILSAEVRMVPVVSVVTKQNHQLHSVPGAPFYPWMHQQASTSPWHQVPQQQFDGCEVAIREQYTL